MKNNTVVTYSLLTHLKETKYNNYSSISELFFPIVKKAIVEYANEYGDIEIKVLLQTLWKTVVSCNY